MTSNKQFLKDFGRTLAAARHKRGFTQEKLADVVGVHRTYIGFIEQGKRNPSIGNIYKISKTLGIPLKELFRSF